MDPVERARRDVVIANRILAQQRVLDAYGHVSIRHPLDPNKYLLARSLSPGIVDIDDIIEFHLDGTPTGPEKRPLYLERFIHGAVYEKRADVKAVLHSHADDLLPFSISKTTRLRPSFMRAATWDRTFPCGTSRASSAAPRAFWC